MQDRPVHQAYELEVAKYPHLQGTKVKVVACAPRTRYEGPPEVVYIDTEDPNAVPITYNSTYTVEFTRDTHGTRSFCVSYSSRMEQDYPHTSAPAHVSSWAKTSMSKSSVPRGARAALPAPL